jgi:hypothetical protein
MTPQPRHTMKQTKTVWNGEKFTEISDAQMPELIATYRERQDQRAKVNGRIMSVQVYAFFVVPALVLFIWFVAHWSGISDGWITFGQDYIFCVLPVCVMFLYVAKAWWDARPYLQE